MNIARIERCVQLAFALVLESAHPFFVRVLLSPKLVPPGECAPYQEPPYQETYIDLTVWRENSVLHVEPSTRAHGQGRVFEDADRAVAALWEWPGDSEGGASPSRPTFPVEVLMYPPADSDDEDTSHPGPPITIVSLTDAEWASCGREFVRQRRAARTIQRTWRAYVRTRAARVVQRAFRAWTYAPGRPGYVRSQRDFDEVARNA